MRVKVVIMPIGKDPADVAKENPEEFKKLVEEAKSVFDFYFETTLAHFDKTTGEGKRDIADALLPVIKKIPNQIEQDNWISRLALEIGAKEESVRAELAKVKEEPVYARSSQDQTADKKKEGPKTRRQLLEERMLALVFYDPSYLALIGEGEEQYLSLETREIVAGLRKNPELDFSKFGEIFTEETAEFLKILSLRYEVEEVERDDVQTPEEVKKEFEGCIHELKNLYKKERLGQIEMEIRQGEREHNDPRVEELKQEFNELSKSLHLL